MKTEHSVQTQLRGQCRESKARTTSAARLNSCRSLVRQIEGIKESVLREFDSPRWEQGEMVRFALNEAEALAWQTPYPHLLFPVLAREKAESARQWAERQTSLRHAGQAFAE